MSSKRQTVIIIPARLGSTRLARKMLLDETGKPLLQHTYEAARRARLASRVMVATDSEEIFAAVQKFGGEVQMTLPTHQSGTDRIAEVAAKLPDCELVINVQGDEPDMAPEVIDQVVAQLHEQPDVPVATAACPIRQEALIHDPSCVKVVMDRRGRALYFSRSPIPFPRHWDASWLQTEPARYFQHLGIYAYRRNFLLGFAELPSSVAEQTESLEQLRVLQAGFPIAVACVGAHSKGIDTAEDYAAFVARQRIIGPQAD
ncbi:MAG: 3-deoxy-manno-octulosonate cytidylyltransferase [Planctomycetaceae bacterium]|nr:3-deoxy-manno-octulosonate cytidylyltransferase [Planctomycetaceae bacterium]